MSFSVVTREAECYAGTKHLRETLLQRVTFLGRLNLKVDKSYQVFHEEATARVKAQRQKYKYKRVCTMHEEN